MEKAEKAWRIWDGDKVKAQFQWEPRDLWVGCFWRRTPNCLHLYICLLPMIPLHVTIWSPRKEVCPCPEQS